MAYTGYPFPYEINNLLVGAVRILYAPTSVALPTDIDSVIDMESPYNAKTGWLELGATKESFTYTRGFDTEGLEIQQSSGVLFEEITDLSRQIEVSAAEFSPEIVKIIEGAETAVATVAAAAGKSAQKKVHIGAFSTLSRFRFAFLARRNQASGIVTESDTVTTRGRFVMGVLYSASMAADDASMEFAKGELTAAGVTFSAFPDSSVAVAANNYGAWYFEDAGAIAA